MCKARYRKGKKKKRQPKFLVNKNVKQKYDTLNPASLAVCSHYRNQNVGLEGNSHGV